MNTHEQVNSALLRLVGLPVVRWRRVVDMAAVGFGAPVAAERRGKSVAVPQFDLHIQETWRITGREGDVLFGYGDWHYPPRGSTIEYGDFDEPNAPRNHQDDLRDDWLAHGADAHTVTRSTGTAVGDLSIKFADGCQLGTFVNQASVGNPERLNDELWRLIEQLGSSSTTAHFIVTAHGIEDDDPPGQVTFADPD